MKNKIYIFLVLIYSCKKTELDGELNFLVGEWDWQYTTVIGSCATMPPPFPYISHTPSSEGYNYTLKFIEKGKLIIKQDGKKDCKYRLVQRTFADNSSDTTYSFYLDNKVKNGIYITYRIKGGVEYIESPNFPQDILNGFDGCIIEHSVFRKKQ